MLAIGRCVACGLVILLFEKSLDSIHLLLFLEKRNNNGVKVEIRI